MKKWRNEALGRMGHDYLRRTRAVRCWRLYWVFLLFISAANVGIIFKNV